MCFLDGDDATHVTQVSEEDPNEVWENVEVTEEFVARWSEDATVVRVTAPVVDGWEYEQFTMGHDTGKNYNTLAGVVSCVTTCQLRDDCEGVMFTPCFPRHD